MAERLAELALGGSCGPGRSECGSSPTVSQPARPNPQTIDPTSCDGQRIARATVARRLATLGGFYRYAVQEGALPHSPVAHVRRPSVARDSQTLGLDREEVVRFLPAAEAASARDHTLAACSP